MPNAMVRGLHLSAGAWRWWLLALVLLIADQVTKIWANTALNYNEPVEITSFFNLTLRYNHGAAFSFLHDQSGWQRWFFTVIATLASIALIVWISRIGRIKEKTMEAAGLSLVLSGALGNLIDRVAYGYVVDFLEAHWQEHYWPAFNVADSAICIGAGLIILDIFLTPKQSS